MDFRSGRFGLLHAAPLQVCSEALTHIQDDSFVFEFHQAVRGD
jgi:hypothetical protein